MVETTLKTLIERFRSKPAWQHSDPAVRAEAVLRLPASERELLVAIARDDTDARVRRAAVKKLQDLEALAAVAQGDADPSVREEAEERLTQLAIHEQAAPAAAVAVAALRDPRQLGLVARSAALLTTQEAAVRALADPRTLAAIVREAEDAGIRALALSRIEDAATLVALALKAENKTVATAAVERIADREALLTIAEKARTGAAARRARARLDEASEPPAPPVAAAPPEGDDEAEREAYERARAAHEREAAARAEAIQARTRLAETIEAASGAQIPETLERARAERATLPVSAGAEPEALDDRIEKALADADRRHAAFEAGLANREQLEALVLEAEQLATAELPAARIAFQALEAKWAGITVAADLPELRVRFQAAAAALRARQDEARAEQSRKEQEHLEKLTRLALRAEALVASGAAAPLRDADQLLREIRDALEHPGHLPSRRERETLTARLDSARKVLYPLVQQLREDAEWKRWANVTVQEELCAKAEALLAEPDIEKTARELRELDSRWKQAKEAPKETAEALWTRFKSAREQVKARADAFFAKQAEDLAGNLAKKEALCERAEALSESTDWLKTAEELRQLQAGWKAIGPVPRAASQRIWERFRKPCDHFFTRWQEHRNQRSQEWSENLKKKEALCERAEALRDSAEWDEASAELKRLQAEWRTIGAVKKSRSDAVWQRFRAACDAFFDRYKNRDEHARLGARAAREAICVELESMLPQPDAAGGEPPADLAARIGTAQTAWRQAGGLPQEEMAAFDTRFMRARDALLETFAAALTGTDLDPEASRRRAERLVVRVESALQELSPADAPQASSAVELAARLKDALATNTMGGQAAIESRWQTAAAELETVQVAWKRLGPLPGADGRALVERFEQACRRFAELRPPERPQPERSRGDRPRGDRPRGERPRGERPRDEGRGRRPSR